MGADLEYGNYTPVEIEGDKLFAGYYIGDEALLLQGYEGIVMVLNGSDGAGNPVGPLTAVTDGTGHFEFTGLRPGTYTVTEQGTQDINGDGIDDVAVQGLVIDTTPQIVTVSSGVDFDFSDLVDLDNDPTTPPVPTYQWVNYIETSFHGIKFHDLNADGVMNDLVDHDGDDPDGDGFKDNGLPATPQRQAVLEGVAFEIYYYTGSSLVDPFSSGSFTRWNWEFVTTEFTDVHGEFWFTGLKPGIYTIRENLATPGPVGQDYSGYFQSTLQAQGTPIFDLVDNPTGDDPAVAANSALLATNSAPFPAGGGFSVPTGNTFAWEEYTGTSPVVGQEYQWSNGTGVAPYEVPAYQRPMDTDGSGFIDGTEAQDILDATALKQALTSDATQGTWSLLWGNYLPVKIIGEKFEDLDADGLDATDPGFANVKFELLRDPDGTGALPAFPVTTAMLAGGSNSINPTGPLAPTPGDAVFTFTDGNGMFMFADVVPGTYIAREAADQDTNVDNIDDVMFQDLVLDGYMDPITVISAEDFDFSAPVDDMDPTTDPSLDEPTHIWLNYVEGSIHGVKFEDIDGDGEFNDTRIVTTTAILQNAPLTPTDTQVRVDDSSVFPQTYPYEIQIGDEVMTVTLNNRMTNTLTVTRGVPVQHIIGATVTGPTTNPATTVPAVLEGVKFDLYRFVRSDLVDKTTFTPSYTRYEWTLVDMEMSDVHGEYWFTDLEPGTYVVRENQESLEAMGLVQSTLQGQGNPSWFLNATPPSMMVPTDDPTVPGIGENPLDPATGAIVVQSRQEYVWEVGAMVMPVDGEVDPNIEDDTHPNYDPTFDPALHALTDGFIDIYEQRWAEAKQNLKTEILIDGDGIALQYGNYTPVMIMGIKYEDLNADGTFTVDELGNPVLFDHDGNPGTPPIQEPFFPNVTFVLTGADGAGNPAVTSNGGPITATTNSLGKFVFSGLRPGTYTIEETATQDTNGDNIDDIFVDPANPGQGLVLGNNVPQMLTVTSGNDVDFSTLADVDNDPTTPAVPAYQWFNYVLGSIHGFKFQDYDRDGIWDQDTTPDPIHPINEPPLEGVTFELWKFTGSTKVHQFTNTFFTRYNWTLVETQVSDVHGEYWFENLMPGYYTVRENLDGSDFKQYSPQAQGSPDVDPLDLDFPHGESPFDAATDAYHVLSRQEYVWKDGAHIMPIDVDGSGEFEPDEEQAALDRVALKIPVNVGSALQYGNNYIPGAFHGFKFEDLNGDGMYQPPSSPYVIGTPLDDSEPGIANILVGLIDETTGEIAIQADGTPALAHTAIDDPNTDVNETGHVWFTNLIPGPRVHLCRVPQWCRIPEDSDMYLPVDSNGDFLEDENGSLLLDPSTWGRTRSPTRTSIGRS